ncbi:nitroreductase family deazaflavin-dependent oxidoreductase [Nocardioides sp. YIM 152315]|uniref:nitroreductase family deazaflavin-dependent oxidoreductase n=1 Tax=Nocardioides sp. YIM 152315 TaxID=3031760 RepID=UPI0023DA2594|nr:nitroreductase family deazaflavin-dependent oxidoreductase [Nocardioides sp. YIM 152315]MDF1604398.1 nitroreductase family deazaflavin-dependent oxidoreductase [Nocardioides sp. YIM 152315]
MSIASRVLSTRWLVRAPIPIFRHGFGWLFGRRLLLLEHVGRTSGHPRYVVLEVVVPEGPDAVIVASGFGPRAQWFRNVVATPACHVTLGRTRRAAVAEVLDRGELDRVLADYARRHPRAWRRLSATMLELNGQPADGSPDIPLVRLVLGEAT